MYPILGGSGRLTDTSGTVANDGPTLPVPQLGYIISRDWCFQIAIKHTKEEGFLCFFLPLPLFGWILFKFGSEVRSQRHKLARWRSEGCEMRERVVN